jgi:Tol biopolymer transport system component
MIVVSRNSADIWVVNADGTGQRRLTFVPNHQENDPAYSPGGARIAYTLNEFGELGNGTCIYVMNATGTTQWNLVRRRTMSARMGAALCA